MGEAHTLAMSTLPNSTEMTLAERAFAMHLLPTEKFISVEEYLDSDYEPDMDYVDGHLGERNVGETEHSELQNALLTLLNNHAREWKIRVYPECRLQVQPERFRVPDILVVPREYRPARIVRQAPLLCIEILSPRDTWRDLMSRSDDYVAMGVPCVWCFDPKRRDVFAVVNGVRAWFTEEDVLTIPDTPIRISREQIDEELSD
jgi:Uma2 family endonuclease